MGLVVLRENIGKDSLIVPFHGWGASEVDLADVVSMIDPGGAHEVWAPRGPFPTPAGMGGSGWYDISGVTDPSGDVPLGWSDSVALVEDELAQVACGRPVNFLGFSQGGTMALACGFSGRFDVSGVIALSTLNPFWAAMKFDSTPVLIQHGKRDDVVPFSRGQELADALEGEGVLVTFEPYDFGHEISPASAAAIKCWLEITSNSR